MDDFEKELKLGFLEEATQLVTDAEQCFLLLEQNPQDTPVLEKIFRIAHNIKGSSKAVGFNSLGEFTHEFENLLLKLKNGTYPVTREAVDILLLCNDHVKLYIDSLKADLGAQIDSSDLIGKLKNFTPHEAGATTAATLDEPEMPTVPDATAFEEKSIPPAVEQSAAVQETHSELPSIEDLEKAASSAVEQILAAPTTPTDKPFDQFDEITQSLQSTQSPSPAKPESIGSAAAGTGGKKESAPATDESVRVSLNRLDRLVNYVGELVILHTVLKEQSALGNLPSVRRTVHQIGKVTKDVQDLSMSLRMLPLKQTFQKMNRIVRDTSALLGKDIKLITDGEETEVDKTVLERLADPLVHLVRNAADHGIEKPEDRVKAGKDPAGKVRLAATHEGDKLVILIQDDGGGIDPEKLRKKAVEKGILKSGQNLSDKEAVNLIFHPGFSTKAVVTEVSGRGVGMDVVKTNIEALQGEIQIHTEVGKGSTFKIILPLTLAIIDAMIVKSGDDRFVVPLAHVHESVKPEMKDIKKTTGVGEMLLLRGENLPIYRLTQLLGKKADEKSSSDQIALIIRTQRQPFAAMVDDILGQHQIVIKKLGTELQNMKGYSGSAILGDGKPALILEFSDLTPKRGAA